MTNPTRRSVMLSGAAASLAAGSLAAEADQAPTFSAESPDDELPADYEDGDRVDFATTLNIPDGSQDAVIEAFEAYLKATKRGHFKHTQIASLLHGFKLNSGVDAAR